MKESVKTWLGVGARPVHSEGEIIPNFRGIDTKQGDRSVALAIRYCILIRKSQLTPIDYGAGVALGVSGNGVTVGVDVAPTVITSNVPMPILF